VTETTGGRGGNTCPDIARRRRRRSRETHREGKIRRIVPSEESDPSDIRGNIRPKGNDTKTCWLEKSGTPKALDGGMLAREKEKLETSKQADVLGKRFAAEGVGGGLSFVVRRERTWQSARAPGISDCTHSGSKEIFPHGSRHIWKYSINGINFLHSRGSSPL